MITTRFYTEWMELTTIPEEFHPHCTTPGNPAAGGADRVCVVAECNPKRVVVKVLLPSLRRIPGSREGGLGGSIASRQNEDGTGFLTHIRTTVRVNSSACVSCPAFSGV